MNYVSMPNLPRPVRVGAILQYLCERCTEITQVQAPAAGCRAVHCIACGANPQTIKVAPEDLAPEQAPPEQSIADRFAKLEKGFDEFGAQLGRILAALPAAVGRQAYERSESAAIRAAGASVAAGLAEGVSAATAPDLALVAKLRQIAIHSEEWSRSPRDPAASMAAMNSIRKMLGPALIQQVQQEMGERK